jgi:hypothetical protein
MKDEIQKVNLGTNEALRVTADGEFIWHPEADAMIEEGDFTSSPAMRHILRALRKALAAPVQEPVAWMSASRFEELKKGFTVMTTLTKQRAFEDDVAIHTTPPAAQRQWVGLTDDEVNSLRYKRDWTGLWTDMTFALAIEAKLKEKNT